MGITLGELVTVCGSKNIGPYLIGLDVICDDEDSFAKIKRAAVITEETIANLYSVKPSAVRIVEFPLGLAFKITLPRLCSSGDIADTDVYGCQQYVPLMELEIAESK